MKLLFIINPKAGRAGNGNLRSTIEKALPKEADCEFYLTTGKNDWDNIKKIINEHEPETLVAVGGDGTINLAARAAKSTSLHLGIIPAGSANGLAANLNIPKNINQAVQLILAGHINPIDVLTINNEYLCLHLSDAGINARMVKRFEEEGSKGMLGYGKQLLKELMNTPPTMSLTLKTPGKTRQIKAEIIVIANASRFGTGVAVNPTGQINDGLFEVILIKPYPWWYIFYFFLIALTGNLHKMKHVKVIQATEAEIIFKQPQDVQIDGEIVNNQKKLKIDIDKKALNVIC